MFKSALILSLALFHAPSALAAAGSTPAGSASPGQSSLDEALTLRNATGALWKAGKYAEAAEMLREALAIYDAERAAGGESAHVAERATTLRALVWNETRAGQNGEAIEHFERLVDLAARHADALKERKSAYRALYERAAALETSKAIRDAWGEVEDLFEAQDDRLMLGQVAHDLGSTLAGVGDANGARRAYRKAIAIRESAGDFDGLNWSRNNLGYSFLMAGDFESALDEFASGLREVRGGRGGAAQVALGHNLRDLGRRLLEGPRPDRRVTAALWDLAESEAQAAAPAVIPPERLLALALEAEVKRVGVKRAGKAAERVLRAISGAPAVVVADLELCAASVFLEAGATREAQSVLGSIQVPPGAVAPYLTVRQRVMEVELAAARGEEGDFDAAVPAALEAIEALGHDATAREALTALADVAKEFPRSQRAKEVVSVHRDRMRLGSPGGAGGASVSGASGPAVERAQALGFDDPLFALTVQGETIVLRDLLSEDEVTVPLQWVVRTVTFHGMSLELFGGYVVVSGVHYGAGQGAKGTRSGLSLNDLENFRPLDPDISLFVTKSGATFYGR